MVILGVRNAFSLVMKMSEDKWYSQLSDYYRMLYQLLIVATLRVFILNGKELPHLPFKG